MGNEIIRLRSLSLPLSCRLRNARDREKTNLTLREWFADQRAHIPTRTNTHTHTHTHTEATLLDRADFLISAVRNKLNFSLLIFSLSPRRSLPVLVDSISRQKQQQQRCLFVMSLIVNDKIFCFATSTDDLQSANERLVLGCSWTRPLRHGLREETTTTTTLSYSKH